jgi:hypothetical protein
MCDFGLADGECPCNFQSLPFAASSSLLPVGRQLEKSDSILIPLKLKEKLWEFLNRRMERDRWQDEQGQLRQGLDDCADPTRQVAAFYCGMCHGSGKDFNSAGEYRGPCFCVKPAKDHPDSYAYKLASLPVGESREPLPDPRCIVKGHLSRVCELGTKCCVVKHSEWRDNGQGLVPSVPAEIESQPFKPEGDMFWDEADTEISHFDPYDILDEHLAGEIVEFEQAKRLPNFFGFSWGRDEEPKEFYFATKEEAEKKLDELTADSTPIQEKPSGSK